MLLLVLLTGFEVDEEGFGLRMVIGVRVVRHTTQLGTGLAFRVGLDTEQAAVVVVGLLEGILIEFFLLREVQLVTVLAVVQEENTEATSADGLVGEQRVRVLLGLFFQLVDECCIRIVDIYHSDARPSGDVFLRFAALEQGSYREADAFGLLELGFFRHPLMQDATMFDSQVPDGVVLTDQSNDLFQGRFFRVTVGVTME